MKLFKWALPAALLLVTTVYAATGNFTWTDPATNTDSSPIPASGPGSLSTKTITYGPCNAGGTALANVTGTISATGTSAPIPTLAPGTWCAQMTVTNTYGNTSAPTNVVSKVVAAPTPGTPTNFTW